MAEEQKYIADQDCIFCSIVSGTTPADIVHETSDTVFFHDVSPKARVHILGIPRHHLVSLADITEADQALIGKLLHDTALVAQKFDLDEGGYRVITNVGSDAGQEVKHIHFHILGGEQLGPLNS